MKKAYFIDGGLGRVLCALPALLELNKTDKDFIIISPWMDEVFLGTELHSRAFHPGHKNLYSDKLKDRHVSAPEPYRLNAYFNQKCSLIDAFHTLINGFVPDNTKIELPMSKREQIDGFNLVNDIRAEYGKEKVIVFQPFGQGASRVGDFIIDPSGRSFELRDVILIIERLREDYGMVLMTQLDLPIKDLGVAIPQTPSLRNWPGIINFADYFIGCDSAGQHIAHGLGKPATVVTGSTFPVNVSYPDDPSFHIIDKGEDKRTYSPIRLAESPGIDVLNEDLMILSEDDINTITEHIRDVLGTTDNNEDKGHMHDESCVSCTFN